MKRSIFLLISCLFLLNMALVYSDCLTPSENTNINASTTLCTDTYNLTDSDGNGAIIINANNVVLDCNGATLQGNLSTNSISIYSNNHDNVTIKNCNIKNFRIGIFSTSTVTDINLLNNNFFNIDVNDGYCIYLNGLTNNLNINNNFANVTEDDCIRLQSGGTNVNISNNKIIDGSFIFIGANSINVSIYNNNITINNDLNVFGSIFISSYFEIYNNIFNYSGKKSNSGGLSINSLNHSNIYNNEFIADGSGVDTIWGLIGGTDTYNTGYNNSIFNNTFKDWNSAIRFGEYSNLKIYNNNITASLEGGYNGTHGILLGTTTDTDITLCEVYDNNIYNMQFGLLFENSAYSNIIHNNNVSNSRIPLYSLHYTRNNIAYNNILGCSNLGTENAGIRLLDNVSGDYYYNNSFIDCEKELLLSGDIDINYSTHSLINFEADIDDNNSIRITCPLDSATYQVSPNEDWFTDCGSGGNWTPEDGETVTSSKTAYTMRGHFDDGITVGASGINLTGNWMEMIGNLTTGYRGIYSVNKNNVIIDSFIVRNYQTNIYFQGGINNIISNINTSGATGENIFVAATRNSLIEYINSSSADGVHGNHGLYISSNFLSPVTENITVRYSKFFNNTNSGIHINSKYGDSRAKYLNISNNLFLNNGVGITDFGSELSNIYQNNITGSDINVILSQDSTFKNGSLNSNYYNNYIANYRYAFRFAFGSENTTLKNNTYDSKINYEVLLADQTVSFNANETNVNEVNVTWNNSAYVLFNYNGQKSFTVENNTINTTNLPTYNSYCNSTSATCLIDQNSVKETVADNGRTIVLSRTEENNPYVISMATTITQYSVTYTEGTSYAISCEGTGSHTVTNLNDIKDSKLVYHNGVFLERLSTETINYTMIGCSDWEIKIDEGSIQLTGITAYIIGTCVVILLIVALLVFILNKEPSIEFYITVLVALIIAIIIIRFILNQIA